MYLLNLTSSVYVYEVLTQSMKFWFIVGKTISLFVITMIFSSILVAIWSILVRRCNRANSESLFASMGIASW